MEDDEGKAENDISLGSFRNNRAVVYNVDTVNAEDSTLRLPALQPGSRPSTAEFHALSNNRKNSQYELGDHQVSVSSSRPLSTRSSSSPTLAIPEVDQVMPTETRRGWVPRKLEPIPKELALQSPRAAQQLQMALSYAEYAVNTEGSRTAVISNLLHASKGEQIEELETISQAPLNIQSSNSLSVSVNNEYRNNAHQSTHSKDDLFTKSITGLGSDIGVGLGSRFSAVTTDAEFFLEEDEVAALTEYGRSAQTSDEKVTSYIREGFTELRLRTENVRANLGGARRHRERIHTKQMKDIKLTRNALPARFLRLNSKAFFLERLADTIARLMRAEWFHRWKVICRALYLIEKERRRKDLLVLQRRTAAQLLFKLQWRHYEFYIRKASKHRFRDWVRRMYYLRKIEMTRCAIKLQGIGRGHVVRQHMKLRWDSAVWLQRVFRGFSVRKALMIRKASECLQRTFRLYHKKYWASIFFQKSYRKWTARLLYIRKRKASIKIQGMARGVEFRYWRIMAALCMQPWWRIIFARRQRTCEKIQARYRAHYQRMKYLRTIRGTIVFESFVRMKLQRIKFLVKLAEHREREAKRKALIKEKRRMKKLAFLYREARKICGHTYTITINNKSSDFVSLVAYRNVTCKSFEFIIKKTTFMKIPLKDAKQGKGVNEEKLYQSLTDRLTERKVFGEIVLRMKKHGQGERGIRMMRRVTSVMGHRYVVSVYKWLGSWVFVAYDPTNQEILRCMFSSHHVYDWLNWTPADPSPPELLRPENTYDLLVWMCTQLILRPHPHFSMKGKQQLLLKPQLRQEVNACKIQCLIRSRLALSKARRMVHKVVQKIMDADSKQFFYKYTNTGDIIWHKPNVLHDMDDIECNDKWERTRDKDGQIIYFHPLSGKYSRISPHDAAVAVQKKFRQSRGKEFRLEFHQLVKALKMIKTTEEKYKLFPNNLPVIVNYALYQHTIVGNYTLARELYEKAKAISGHNPVILYGYGLLMLMGNFYPRKKYYMVALDLFQKAQLMDEQRTVMSLAKQSFFHWAVVSQPESARAMANYGLFHQYIENHEYKARKYLRRAINIDPDDESIIACWDELENPEATLTPSERKLFDNPNTRDYMFQVAESQGKAAIEARKEKEMLISGDKKREEEERINELAEKGRSGDGLKIKPPSKNVKLVLDSLGLGTYLYMIGDLGVETVSDMQELENDDLVPLGLKKIQIRKLLKRLKEKDPVAASQKKNDLKNKTNLKKNLKKQKKEEQQQQYQLQLQQNYQSQNEENFHQTQPEVSITNGTIREYFKTGDLCNSTEWKEAALKLQGLFRSRKARKYMQILLASIFQKLWDDENQCYYYVNTKTGDSSWFKPACLGNNDLRDSTYDYY